MYICIYVYCIYIQIDIGGLCFSNESKKTS